MQSLPKNHTIPFSRIARTALLSVLACTTASLSAPTNAQAAVRTYHDMTTGNGHGFQIFNREENRITMFLETPVRYVAPPDDARKGRTETRDLAHDIYFGVRAGGSTTWLHNQTDVEYEEQSHIIHGASTQNGVKTDTYYFAPYGLDANAMVMLIRAENTSGSSQVVNLYAKPNLKLGAGRPDPTSNGESIDWDGTKAVETGPGGGHAIYIPIGGADAAGCGEDTAIYSAVEGGGPGSTASCTGDNQVIAFQKNATLGAGETAWWGVAILFVNDNPSDPTAEDFRDYRSTGDIVSAWDAFAAGRSAETIHNDALMEFEDWRVEMPMGLSPEEQTLWRQSEAVMRMGQILEPDQANRVINGAYLASIPPGTVENNFRFSWYIPWVRDGAYAIAAAAMIGHTEEAQKGLTFMLNADNSFFSSPKDRFPGTGYSYRISATRYYGNGKEEGDWDDNGYNFETDGWGLALWAAGAIVREGGQDACDWLNSNTALGDTVYSALVEVAGDIEEQVQIIDGTEYLPMAESGIWEVHHDFAKVFTFTAIAQIRGLYDFAMIADAVEDTARANHARDLADKMLASMMRLLVNQADKSLAGNLTNAGTADHHDGAVIEGLNWGMVPPESEFYTGTLQAMDVLSTGLGYVRLTQNSHPQNAEKYNPGYDGREWAVLDLAAAEAFRRLGTPAEVAEADRLMARVTALAAANDYLISELYGVGGEEGVYRGSPPMVGYGAGAWMRTILDRGGKSMPHYSEAVAPCSGETPDVVEDGLGGTDTPRNVGMGGAGSFNDSATGTYDPNNPDSMGSGMDGASGPACFCSTPGKNAARTPWQQVVLALGLLSLFLIRRAKRA